MCLFVCWCPRGQHEPLAGSIPVDVLRAAQITSCTQTHTIPNVENRSRLTLLPSLFHSPLKVLTIPHPVFFSSNWSIYSRPDSDANEACVTLCSEQTLQSMEIWTAALVVLSSIDSLAASAAALCSPGKSLCLCSQRDDSESACVLLTCSFQRQPLSVLNRK